MSERQNYRRELRSYGIGLAVSLVLSGGAFVVVAWKLASTRTALAWVFGLALLQIVAQFRFFLHLDPRKSTREDLQLVLFSALIIAIMVSGTVVILLNLRHRMM